MPQQTNSLGPRPHHCASHQAPVATGIAMMIAMLSNAELHGSPADHALHCWGVVRVALLQMVSDRPQGDSSYAANLSGTPAANIMEAKSEQQIGTAGCKHTVDTHRHTQHRRKTH